MWVQRPKDLGHLLLLSQATAESWIGMEQPGFKLALKWDAGTAGSNFTRYATVLVPGCFLKCLKSHNLGAGAVP